MFALFMGLKTISPKELHQLMVDTPLTVVDVNSRQSWMKAHVPGALNIDPEHFKDSDLPTDKNSALVFYCSGPLCMKAPNAAQHAKRLGHTNVRVMSAGIGGWLAAQLPIETIEQK